MQYLLSVTIEIRDFTLCYGNINVQLSVKKSLNLIETFGRYSLLKFETNFWVFFEKAKVEKVINL